ncbi:MAG: 3-keto-5-aminohexanoate cleavage protein [Labilithrix sp.]|nr:3-keto-5-aminohexanoate cleavage protein [Labilithrix sp.]
MSAHDAHYAGELVDGARMLALFGDVATELLIRLDGDEGLFRAYESVEFLAPVFSGDYIEATAELVAIGTTSRKMRFEARKVIANVRERGVAPSAADVLGDPLVVCRAIGTCVTPKEMQRRPKELYVPALPFGAPSQGPNVVVTPASEGGPRTLASMERHAPEVILTAAIVGAEITRAQTPHLPITPEEIADEAARCREAGVAVIHLHVRNDDGSPTQSKDRFAATIEKIRAKTDCIIQVSTGGAIGMSIDERAQPLSCKPEMATLNCGSLNFGDEVFVNTRPEIKDLAKRLEASGAVAELECYEVGHVEEALALAEKGVVAKPLHFQFVLGVPGGIGAREENVRFMAGLIPPGATWAVAAVGRFQQPMTELAMRLGGHARVGLEDNIYLSKGVLSEGSAPLVARAAAYARSIGRTPVEPSRARAMLLQKANA